MLRSILERLTWETPTCNGESAGEASVSSGLLPLPASAAQI